MTDSPVALSRSFQSWLLDLLAWTVLPAEPDAQPLPPAGTAATASPAADAPSEVTSQVVSECAAATPLTAQAPLILKDALIKKLKKWHRRLLQDGLQFDQLSIESRHELRKLGKKLRYALQFTESLLPTARLKAYRKQLAAVQDILGEMNDLAVARDRFILLRDAQPSAWFACGWITSRLDALTQDACAAFKQLSRTETFWR